jgi:hypothetical protein
MLGNQAVIKHFEIKSGTLEVPLEIRIAVFPSQPAAPRHPGREHHAKQSP